jgi:hypothetical protein
MNLEFSWQIFEKYSNINSHENPISAVVRAILLLVANGSSQLHKMYQSRCMAKNSWWWAERLPETCRVVMQIKIEFSVSLGFIQKEYFPFVYR